MSFYNHKEIEPKWQKYWADHHTFKTGTDASKPKFYALDMFPYPSGAGLHVGHPEGYTATDILSRFKRAQGYNVLHPMGWDAFGLPAEQYAMDTGNDPAEFTAENIANFKRQINALGFSYDWDREVNTTDPNYYKWTQWIFTKLYEKGLAYEAEVPVNWVEELGTAIANEEVLPDGTSERGGYPVVRKPMRQWMLKITAYAELAEGLVEVDTAGWAEGWEKLSSRIKGGFESIAKEMEEQGGGNALVVSHGMTIGTIVYLINGMHPHGLDNGSVTILEYENGQFTVQVVGDRSYRELGREKIEEIKN